MSHINAAISKVVPIYMSELCPFLPLHVVDRARQQLPRKLWKQ